MKRLYGLILTLLMLAFGFGTGCLVADGYEEQGDCCVNFERCETWHDPFGNSDQSCWFETSCSQSCEAGTDEPDQPGDFCYNDSDCPGDDLCLRNECRPPDTTERGDAGLCQACETNADCADPDALCVRLGPAEGGGETICGQPCDGGCPDGFECAQIGHASQCLPTPDAQNQRSCQGAPELECVRAGDCDAGESCVNNRCEAPDDAECKEGSDCPSGEECRQGACVERDAPECITRNDCSTGQVCVDGECSGGQESCVFNEECPDEAMCVDGTCFSACAEDAECGAYEHCRQGLCQPTECSGTADCGGGEVCVDAMCKPACEPNTSTEACGPGYSCTEHGFCDRDPEVECRSNAECLRAEICVEGSCEAPCTCNQDCADGQVCDLDSGTCEDPGADAPLTCETTCDCASGAQCNNSGECV